MKCNEKECEIMSKKMTLEEEVKKLNKAAGKRVKMKVQKVLDIRNDGTPENTNAILEVYGSITDKEAEQFNSLLIAINAIVRKRDNLALFHSNLCTAYDNVTGMLAELRDLDDKAILLNAIEGEKAETFFHKITTDLDAGRITKGENGGYIVEPKNITEIMTENRNDFTVAMEGAKTVFACIDIYKKEYYISELSLPEIEYVKEAIMDDFTIDADLFAYYEKYRSFKGNKEAGSVEIEYEPPFSSKEVFVSYESAKIIKEAFKNNPVKL